MASIDDLLSYLRESDSLLSATRLLQWDQETMMPEGGESARSESLAALSRLHHARGTSVDLEELSAKAASQATPGSWEMRMTELVDRELTRSRKVPASLVEALTRTTSRSQQAWAKAKKNRDFKAFQPHLQEVVLLKREEGKCLAPEGGIPYDGLLNDYEFGMTSSQWDALFDDLEPQLRTLLPKVLERQEPARQRVASCTGLKGPFATSRQMEACRLLASSIGYDFARGRLDISSHPFSESIHAGDSRITTRIDEGDLGNAFFSVLHETGHALYEQGLPEQWAGTPLGGPVSMAVHESQSRLWENIVGRSRKYWESMAAPVSRILPEFSRFPLDTFLESVNLVRPSLVRTESDEVTYNLHIMIRYRLEKALISGDLDVADLPRAWNEAYQDSLGIKPEHDGAGVLQDVHWSAGYFGYFPTYTLGNLLSAQLMATARTQIDTDNLPSLLDWLRTKVHAKGHLQDTTGLIRSVCGSEPGASDFVKHLKAKYLE
jgi:carboxypeptidase Taq